MSANLSQQYFTHINQLKCDHMHGASWLSGQALHILKTVVQESKAITINQLAKEINTTAEELISARSDMVSIANYIMQFKEEMPAIFTQRKRLEGVKTLCVNRVEQLIKYSEKSSRLAAQNAAGIISNNIIVITCSYSSAVCHALKTAHKKKTNFKVLVTDSIFNEISYGKSTTASLNKAKIVTQSVPDEQIQWQMARADIVLLGADSISFHGYFINGTPSLELVRIANRRKVPVYLVCELTKVDVRGILAGLREPEPGFDMIPLELVTAIITETETLKPEDIYQFAKEDIFRSLRAGTH